MVCHFLVGQFDLKFYWNIHIGWLRFLLVYSFFSSVSFFLNPGISVSDDPYSVIFQLKPDTFTFSIIPLLLIIFLSWPYFNLVDSIQIKKRSAMKNILTFIILRTIVRRNVFHVQSFYWILQYFHRHFMDSTIALLTNL